MQNLRFRVLLCLLLVNAAVKAQNPTIIQDYINAYKDLAIEEMQRSGVPAAIKLAQGIHETLAGTSDLVLASNNHFGIKCKDTWKGESVVHDDDLRGECFRKYATASESYKDHSDFLRGSNRYSFLFALDPTDYKHWAYGLKKAGYATNPHYPQILIRLIEDYHLEDYTLIALGRLKNREEVILAKNDPPNEIIPEPAVVVRKEEPVVVKKEEPVASASAGSVIEKIVRSTYPTGEFKINETRVVYAKRGTAYLAIAEEYDVPLARIFEFNDMGAAESLNEDQLIYLQRKRKTGNNDFHTVQSGETLRDIAQTEAIRLETLLQYNWLTADMKPAIGEKLSLKTKADAKPRLALKETYALYSRPGPATGTVKPASFITYKVKAKETIYSISRKFNVEVEDIMKWNHLKGRGLKLGQPLKINK